MPGILYHLAFAEEVLRNMEEKGYKVSKEEFFAGNLIPDRAVDKKQSHYRIPASAAGFIVPDMEVVKKDLKDKDNSIKLGMYCHLYLDYHFIENYLIPEFIWDADKMQVINPRTGMKWPVEEFFAKPAEGGILYNGYTQINKLLMADGHIKQETIDMLPDRLPLSGIELFDSRLKKTWREELNVYLAEDEPYTGEPLDYDRLWSSISKIAMKFVEEEL